MIFKGDTTFVEIEVGDQKYERKQVKLGLSSGIRIQVLDGLEESTRGKVEKKIL
ncbi:MAG: hypothetical protein IPL46_23880 [Saprospiraceae bacterium]|nr:hypothetical protein [Saprospiraceae bacterium]